MKRHYRENISFSENENESQESFHLEELPGEIIELILTYISTFTSV